MGWCDCLCSTDEESEGERARMLRHRQSGCKAWVLPTLEDFFFNPQRVKAITPPSALRTFRLWVEGRKYKRSLCLANTG